MGLAFAESFFRQRTPWHATPLIAWSVRSLQPTKNVDQRS